MREDRLSEWEKALGLDGQGRTDDERSNEILARLRAMPAPSLDAIREAMRPHLQDAMIGYRAAEKAMTIEGYPLTVDHI